MIPQKLDDSARNHFVRWEKPASLEEPSLGFRRHVHRNFSKPLCQRAPSQQHGGSRLAMLALWNHSTMGFKNTMAFTLSQKSPKPKKYFTSSDPHHDMSGRIFEDIFYICWPSIWHIFWHSFWHSIWHKFWHSIWHIFWQSIWHIFWHSIWHSIWHIFWHSIWLSLSDIFSDILSGILFDIYSGILSGFLYLTYILTFYLAFYLT